MSSWYVTYLGDFFLSLCSLLYRALTCLRNSGSGCKSTYFLLFLLSYLQLGLCLLSFIGLSLWRPSLIFVTRLSRKIICLLRTLFTLLVGDTRTSKRAKVGSWDEDILISLQGLRNESSWDCDRLEWLEDEEPLPLCPRCLLDISISMVCAWYNVVVCLV